MSGDEVAADERVAALAAFACHPDDEGWLVAYQNAEAAIAAGWTPPTEPTP